MTSAHKIMLNCDKKKASAINKFHEVYDGTAKLSTILYHKTPLVSSNGSTALVGLCLLCEIP
jgi:hypothetical protein